MDHTLRNIIKAIEEFDEECKDLEHTDVGEVWDLFVWIKRQAEEALLDAALEENHDHS